MTQSATQRLTADCAALDLAMTDPAKVSKDQAKLSMGDLMRRRAEAGSKLEEAEARWIEVSEQLETLAT